MKDKTIFKRVKSCCFSFFFLICFCGCISQVPSPAYDLAALASPYVSDLNTFPGAFMEVTEIHVSGLTVQITLDDALPDDHFLTGEGFWLDYCFQGQWYAVPLAEGKTLGFADTGYNLAPGSSFTLEQAYYSFYGALPPGRFRIVKSCSRGYGQASEEFYLSAEFDIQEDTFS